MKVILINGSPKSNGCTFTALSVFAEELKKSGIESEIVHVGTTPVQDCVSCGGCRKVTPGKCVIKNDMINEIIDKIAAADGLVIGSPVYYAHPTGRILSVLDRVFYAGGASFAHKPAFAIASARRAGTSSSLDCLQKYINIASMPLVPSTYWPMVHGNRPEDVMQDEEGLQSLRNGANNMAWMIKCIELGKQNGVQPPILEKKVRTNFIK